MSNYEIVPGKGKVKKDNNFGIIFSSTNESFHMQHMTPYERTKRQVYATGNKWAIENFHATHD